MTEPAVNIAPPVFIPWEQQRAETKRKALLYAKENPNFIRKYFELRRLRSEAQAAFSAHMENPDYSIEDGLYSYQEFWLDELGGDGSISLVEMLDAAEACATPGESVTVSAEDA